MRENLSSSHHRHQGNSNPANAPQAQPTERIHLSDLKRCPTPELVELAEGIGIDNIGRARKQDIITQIFAEAIPEWDRSIRRRDIGNS